MGQYHYIANVDKREYIEPQLRKAIEQAWNLESSMLVVLLTTPIPRGGGDFPDSAVTGRWAGDRIIMAGDYAEEGDHPTIPVENIYGEISEGQWTCVNELFPAKILADLSP